MFLREFQFYISAALSASDFQDECVLNPQMNTYLHKLQYWFIQLTIQKLLQLLSNMGGDNSW